MQPELLLDIKKLVIYLHFHIQHLCYIQPYATRLENVQPYLISQWIGKIELTPSGDEWFETEVAPALIY